MDKSQWVYCPSCGHKTRIKVRRDTILINFPLFCPKCRQESLVNIKNQKLLIVSEPDAKTQC